MVLKKLSKKKNSNEAELGVFVGLASSLAFFLTTIAVLMMLFAKEQLDLLIPISWAFVVLGIVLGAFMSRFRKK